MSSDEERRPLVFRVNANPNWNSQNGRSQSTALSSSESGDLRSSLTIPSGTSRVVNPPLTWSVRYGCLCILFYIVFERIAFHGLVGNLVLFLNKSPFLWVSYDAQSTIFLFFGIAFLMAPVGGWLADSFFGRFRTMIIAFVIYFSGYIMLPFISLTEDEVDHKNTSALRPLRLPDICAAPGNVSMTPKTTPFDENCSWLVYLILLMIAIADGISKSNLGPFGSDQLSNTSSITNLSFFNWYYWCVNLGAFIGLGAMAYIEQQISFHLGYIICTVCLGVGIVVFIAGRFFYTCRPPDGSILTNIFKIIREAFKRKRQRCRLQKLTTNNTQRQGHGIFSEEVDSAINTDEKLSFLDYAKHQHGGIFHNSLVNDVKKLKMILAVFAALLPYWLVYFQMQTSFLFQALHMKLTFAHVPLNHDHPNFTDPDFGNRSHIIVITNGTVMSKPEMVAAWFSLFDVLFVIVLLPLFDRVIYPRLARAGYPFTFAKRIVLGMVFSIAAMIVAGVVEMYRLKTFWPYDEKPCYNVCITQMIANTEYQAANMSVLWQIPQYALIGISEVFASVACLQFAVSVAPKSMKALITGLFYTFCGFGSLIGTALPFIFSRSKIWFFSKDYGNINCRLPCTAKEPYVNQSCHLDYYFFLLGGFEVIGVFIFLYVSYTFGLNRDQLLAYNRPVMGHVQRQTVQRQTSTTPSS